MMEATAVVPEGRISPEDLVSGLILRITQSIEPLRGLGTLG